MKYFRKIKQKTKCLIGLHQFSEWKRTNPSNTEKFLGDWKQICQFCGRQKFRPGLDLD